MSGHRMPPCTNRDPRLFDSTVWQDHMKARAVCATCPMVTACIERAVTVASRFNANNRDSRGPDGTWGGLLWVNGHVVTSGIGAERAAA